MSSNLRDDQRFYAVFQPSAYSTGIQHYEPLNPKLWNSPVYGQRVPWLEPFQGVTDLLTDDDVTPEESLGKRMGSMAGLLAGLAANSKVPWLKNRFIVSRVLFVVAASGLGRELGEYVGRKMGDE